MANAVATTVLLCLLLYVRFKRWQTVRRKFCYWMWTRPRTRPKHFKTFYYETTLVESKTFWIFVQCGRAFKTLVVKYHFVCEVVCFLRAGHINSIIYNSTLDYIWIASPLDIPEISLFTEVALDYEITLKFVVFPLHEHVYVCSFDYT